jgi:alcohol dehydrogenase, propanol-preferring
VLGSIVGTRTDLREVFELHAAGKTEIVYERRRLADVNTAIHEVETGQVKARLVFGFQ